jgi:hypothetical protein
VAQIQMLQLSIPFNYLAKCARYVLLNLIAKLNRQLGADWADQHVV